MTTKIGHFYTTNETLNLQTVLDELSDAKQKIVYCINEMKSVGINNYMLDSEFIYEMCEYYLSQIDDTVDSCNINSILEVYPHLKEWEATFAIFSILSSVEQNWSYEKYYRHMLNDLESKLVTCEYVPTNLASACKLYQELVGASKYTVINDKLYIVSDGATNGHMIYCQGERSDVTDYVFDYEAFVRRAEGDETLRECLSDFPNASEVIENFWKENPTAILKFV